LALGFLFRSSLRLVHVVVDYETRPGFSPNQRTDLVKENVFGRTYREGPQTGNSVVWVKENEVATRSLMQRASEPV
jgi:hypothetical protein